jgi:SAM-dependent methyltransferase
MAVKWSGAGTGSRALDVCCGSGDLAFRLAEAVGPSGSVVGLDFSANMLTDAARRQRQREQTLGPKFDIQWVQVRLMSGVLGARLQALASDGCSCWPMSHEHHTTCVWLAGRRHGAAV